MQRFRLKLSATLSEDGEIYHPSLRSQTLAARQDLAKRLERQQPATDPTGGRGLAWLWQRPEAAGGVAHNAVEHYGPLKFSDVSMGAMVKDFDKRYAKNISIIMTKTHYGKNYLMTELFMTKDPDQKSPAHQEDHPDWN